MFNKSIISPHSATTSFNAGNSYQITTSADLRIIKMLGAEVGVYTSSNAGLTWTLSATISSQDRMHEVSLSGDVTHVNFISSNYRPVFVYPLENGISGLDPEFIMAGDTISSSEQLAVETRIAQIESRQLGHRQKILLSPDPSRVAGETIPLGSNAENLDQSSKLVFLNGLLLHSDDYTLNSNGDIVLSVDLTGNATISVVAWE